MATKCRGCYRHMDGEIIFFLPNGKYLCKDCYEFQHFFLTNIYNFVQWEVIREKFRLYKCGNTQFYPEYFDEFKNNNSCQFQPNHLIEKTFSEKSEQNNSTLEPDSVQKFFAQYGCVQKNNDEENVQHDQNYNVSPQSEANQINEQHFRRYSQDSNPYSEQNPDYLSQYWTLTQQYAQPIWEQYSHEYQQYPNEYQQYPNEYQQYPYEYQQYPYEYQQYPYEYQQYPHDYLQNSYEYQQYLQRYAQQNLDGYSQKNAEQYSQEISEPYLQGYQQYPEKDQQECQLYSQQHYPDECYSQQTSEQYQEQFHQHQVIQHEQRKQNDEEELNCEKEQLDQKQYQTQGAKPKENGTNQNDRPQPCDNSSRRDEKKIHRKSNTRTESHESNNRFQNNSHRGRGGKLYGYNKKRSKQSKVQTHKTQYRSNRHNDLLPSEKESREHEELTSEKLERQNQTHEYRKQLLKEKVESWLKGVAENSIKNSTLESQYPILEEEENWSQEDDNCSSQRTGDDRKGCIQDRRIQNSEITTTSNQTEMESANLKNQEITAQPKSPLPNLTEDQNFNLDKWNQWLANKNQRLKNEKSVKDSFLRNEEQNNDQNNLKDEHKSGTEPGLSKINKHSKATDTRPFKSETSTTIKESVKINRNGPLSSWEAFKKSCDSKVKSGSSNRIPGCSTPASSSCSLELDLEKNCNNLNI